MDIQKLSSKLPINFIWSKYPNEKHLPGHNFTGPGTRLDLRLDENNNPLPNSKPINKINISAYHHDLIYDKYEDKNIRH